MNTLTTLIDKAKKQGLTPVRWEIPVYVRELIKLSPSFGLGWSEEIDTSTIFDIPILWVDSDSKLTLVAKPKETVRFHP